MESKPEKGESNDIPQSSATEHPDTNIVQETPLSDFVSAFAEGREGFQSASAEENETLVKASTDEVETVQKAPADEKETVKSAPKEEEEETAQSASKDEKETVQTAPTEEKETVQNAPTETNETVQDAPGPSSSSDHTNIPQTFFYIKRFQTPLKEQPIILQSVNGPCPLIAIVNCLLLQQRIDIARDCECITASSLCSLLGNYLLDRAQRHDQEKNHSEQYILDCMERFVQIQTGIDVNVKFNGVEGFEYTPELSLFDLAQVRLLHGWVVDPQDKFLSELVGDLTYNQLVEKTMEKSSSSDTKEVSESLVLKEHLESSQLTVHGICEINGALSPGDVVVLFRNNHFSTITKHKERLYVLVTDIGWAEETQVAWETLDSTCNSSSFVDGFFNLATTSAEKTTVLTDEDYALSLELQISKEEQDEQQRLWDQAKMINERSKEERATQPRPQKEKSAQKETKKSDGGCSVM